MQCQTVLEIFTVSPSFHRKVKSEHEGHSVMSDCDLTDCSPPGSSVRGILQARILEWVGFPFSGGSSQPRGWTRVSLIACGFFTNWATREPPPIEETFKLLCTVCKNPHELVPTNSSRITVCRKSRLEVGQFCKGIYAAAAKSLQSCPTLCSRQEHWSGLPFPSPMHESEKWKWSCSVMSDS